MRWDYIVVGGGITGLQISALLSCDGYKILLLEKGKLLGGRAKIEKRSDFIFDYGIHLIRFGPKSAISKIFSHIGEKIGYTNLGDSYLKCKNGEITLFPTSPGGFLKTKLLTPLEKIKAIKMMLLLRKIDTKELATKSLEEWMNENNITGGLREYLTLVSGSMMVCPFIEKTSAGEMFENMKKVLKIKISVMYPKDGWEYIFNTLTNKIKTNGEIKVSTKVDEVIIEDNKVKGVRIENETIEAKNVIISVPSQEFFSFLLKEENFPHDFVKKCKENIPTSGISIDYGLKKTISNSTGLWYLQHPLSFGIFTSNLYQHLAPPGKQILTWFYPTSLEIMSNPELAKQEEKTLEGELFKLFPNLENNIEVRRSLHLKMVDGTQVNINQTQSSRPPFRSPNIDNLFFVGDSLGAPGAGGDVGHESVLCCYKLITGKEI